MRVTKVDDDATFDDFVDFVDCPSMEVRQDSKWKLRLSGADDVTLKCFNNLTYFVELPSTLGHLYLLGTLLEFR